MALTFNTTYKVIQKLAKYTVASGTISELTPSGNNFDVFTDTAQVGDWTAFAGVTEDGKFNELKLNVTTGLVATAITGVWEYTADTGSGIDSLSWTALAGVTDGTNSFQTVGLNSVTFTLPEDWANFYRISPTSGSYYFWWIRFRITALTTLTEGGRITNSTNNCTTKHYSIYASGYTSGSPLTMQTIYDADVAGGWGVVTKTDRSYTFNCNLNITDASYITSTQEIIQFKKNFFLIGTASYPEWHIGLVYSGSKVYNGSTFVFIGKNCNYPSSYNPFGANSVIYNTQFRHSYDTTKNHNGYWGAGIGTYGGQTIADVYFEKFRQVNFTETTNSIDGVKFYGGQVEAPGAICRDITAFGGSYSFRPAGSNKDHYVHSSDMSKASSVCINPWAVQTISAWTMDYVDCLWGTLAQKVIWWIHSTVTYTDCKIYETYSMLLNLIDENNNPIQGAKVTLTDANGTEVFNYISNAEGYIGIDSGTVTSATSTTITDSTKAWSTSQHWFKELFITAGTAIGERRIVKKSNTATTLTAHAPFATTPNTTSKYIIIPYVRVKSYVPVAFTVSTYQNSTVTNLNPFTLKIQKSGYNTYKEKFTMSDKVNWTIAMKRSNLTI